MTVGKLKEMLKDVPDDMSVEICVNTPGGYICPDGATVGVKMAMPGIDWHMEDFLLVPTNKLDIHDVGKWSHREED